jgi:L-serine dehydratase
LYKNAEMLLSMTQSDSCRICDVVLKNEAKTSGTTPEKIIDRMDKVLEVMLEASNKGLQEYVMSVSGMSGGSAKLLYDRINGGHSLSGGIIPIAMARALSCSEVNASMGKIVAAPTAGSCGILPAVIITCGEALGCDRRDMIDGLFTASGIGQIIGRNATLAGAEGGCQAECGSAAAMAAAAAVEMSGGTPEMAFSAGAIALQNVMGLVCDPIAGLVEVPCANRNASGAVNAITSAEMALAGIRSFVPFDQVVFSMYRVGKAMPEELRETAMGGIAATPIGEEMKKKYWNTDNNDK